jgi:hypothetical protein
VVVSSSHRRPCAPGPPPPPARAPRHPACPSSLERETRDRAVARTRATLGDEAYEAAYAEGGDLSAEEAAALV